MDVEKSSTLTYEHSQRLSSFSLFGRNVQVDVVLDSPNNCCTKLIHGMHPNRQTMPQDRASLMQHDSMLPTQCLQYDMEYQVLDKSFQHLQSFRPSFPMIYCQLVRLIRIVPPFRTDVHGKYLSKFNIKIFN